MSEVIVITSGKGGVGKTTTTANVGTGLAKEGKKVVLIDTDIGLRNLDVVMGLENRIVYNRCGRKLQNQTGNDQRQEISKSFLTAICTDKRQDIRNTRTDVKTGRRTKK